MINLELRVSNPFSNKHSITSSRHGKTKEDYGWEINTYDTNTIISLYLRLQARGDHPGIFIMIGLFGKELELNFYDTRHGQ